MKAILTLFILNTGLVYYAFAQNAFFSKPGKSINFYMDGNSWVHRSTSTYNYNAAGKQTEKTDWNAQSNQPEVKQLNQWDSLGNFKTGKLFHWENGNWQFRTGGRDSLVYKSGKLTTKYHFEWNGLFWTEEKVDYIYDTNDYLIQENYYSEDSLIGRWDTMKIFYTNDASGLITKKRYFKLYGYDWMLTRSEVYFSWHIPNILPASFSYDTTGVARFTTYLGENGSQTTISESLDTTNNTWKAYHRETITNDFRGNLINHKFENLNHISGILETTTEYGRRYTYNPYFDITECVEYWNEANIKPLVIKDRLKTVYSNFQYFGQVPEKVVTTYPNPTDGIVNIGLEKEEEQLKLIVYDLSGKARLTKSFTSQETKQLDITALPKGIYLLQLQTETGSEVKRIVKQ